jgi:Phosphorylated CTD interacting factor 1 WW domain
MAKISKINKKIRNEYVNFMGAQRKLKNMYFITDNELKSKIYKHLQQLMKNRILYRYKKKSPPYHSYHPVKDDEEFQLIDDFFARTKHTMEKNNEKGEMYDKLQEIRNFFIHVMNTKRQLFPDMYRNKDVHIEMTDDYIKYRKVKINLKNDERLKYLLHKMGEHKFLRMMLRYLGYGITNQHCSIPYNVYKYMYENFHIKGEGFGSPLNSKLLKLRDTVLCTLFKDTDKHMGSKGPFSSRVMVKNSDKNWTVNPPYIEDIMYTAYQQIMKAFKKIERNDFLVIYFMPFWEHNKTYNKLKESKYLVKLVEPTEEKQYVNCNGKVKHVENPISVFFLCKDQNVVTEDKVNEMMKLWNKHDDDTEHQSSFTVPEIL